MKKKIRQNREKMLHYAAYYIGYTVLFALCFLFIIKCFDNNGKSFIWELDGAPMLYPVCEYLGRSFRDFSYSFLHDANINVKYYDFSLGMGKSIVQYAGNWYFEPLTLITALFDKEHLVSIYQYFVILRYYLCGISFSLFCFYKKESYFSTLLGSMTYVFSFYTLFWGVRFPLFLVPMIYFPLLLLGMDQQLKENNSTILIGMVFLSAWTHYYYFVINTMFLAIFFIAEWAKNFKEYHSVKTAFGQIVKKGIGVCRSYFIGCSMAAVVLLPNIYVFLHANRQAGKLNIPNIWWYGKEYCKRLWCYIAAPYEGFSIGYEAVLGLLPLTAAGIAMLIAERRQKTILCGLLAGGVCLLFPVCSYILCGFSNVNNRWIYGFVFLSSYGLCRFFSDFRSMSSKQWIFILVYIFIYGVSLYTVCRDMRSEYTLAYAALFLASVLSIQLAYIIRFRFANILIVLILCVQIIAWEYYLYMPVRINYISQFMDRETVRDKICDMSDGFEKTEDDGIFFRTDVIEPKRSNLAASVLTGYYGSSDYSNVMNENEYRYLLSVENAGLQENIMNYDLDGRTYLLAQNSVKYIACSEMMQSYLPYGYFPCQEAASRSGIPYKVYCNEFALPLGYAYDTYILQSECSDNPIERQEIFLNTLVLDEDVENIDKKVSADIEKCTSELSYQIVSMNNVVKNGNVYTVLQGGGDIVLEYIGVNEAETYVRLVGLDISTNNFLDWTWFVDNGSGNSKELFIMSDFNYYRPDTHNYLVNLGYASVPAGRCVIHIPQQGEFTLERIEVLAQRFGKYEETIAKRKECVLRNIDVHKNGISGDIEVSNEKLLFLSIPYDCGWSAAVDGVEEKIIRANIGYMALQLSPGKHHIEMRYTIPGLKAGVVLSIIGWMVYFADFFVRCFLKQEKKRYDRKPGPIEENMLRETDKGRI
ncbi:MAG: YfhO family protein [Lachnospiraceae bacterium]|nr:YfhO family protein [Lachnospiraceae bacterium]